MSASASATTHLTRPVLVPDPAEPIIPLLQRPTFAVVTAIYQGADVIAENATGILSGTLPPDEYIVCDDGSTDGIVEALAPFGDRITLIRKENGGAASAYNVAVRAARSDFIVQTDHDDTFLPERLEAIAELATIRPDLDVIATDALMEFESRTVARYNELNRFAVDDQRDEALRSCFFGWPAIRRERFLKIGGFDERLRSAWDWDCWIRLVLDGAVVGLVNEPLYRWRLHHGSISADVLKNFRENVTLLQRLLDDHPSLTDRDRTIIDEVIVLHRRRIALMDAKAALLERREDTRRRLLDVVVGSGFSIPARAKAALSLAAPSLSRRLLERQLAASTTGGWELADR